MVDSGQWLDGSGDDGKPPGEAAQHRDRPQLVGQGPGPYHAPHRLAVPKHLADAGHHARHVARLSHGVSRLRQPCTPARARPVLQGPTGQHSTQAQPDQPIAKVPDRLQPAGEFPPPGLGVRPQVQGLSGRQSGRKVPLAPHHVERSLLSASRNKNPQR